MGTGRVGLQRAAALEELPECSLLAPGPGPDIRGTAPSNGQRRATLQLEVDPRDHLFPSLQKKKKERKKKGRGEGVMNLNLTTWVVQYFWKLKGPNSPSTGVHVGREGA